MNRFRISILLPILLLCGVSAAISHQQRRRGSRYLIPKGYVGWVKVNFKVVDAPALPIEDGYYLFKFPAAGVIKTSSDMEYGSGRDEYYYLSSDNCRDELKVTGWSRGGMLWGQFNGSGQGPNNEWLETYQYFFVGTENQFKRCAYLEKELDGHPKVGALEAATLAKCTAPSDDASNKGMQRTRN